MLAESGRRLRYRTPLRDGSYCVGYSCWYTICQKPRHTQPVDRFVVHHEKNRPRVRPAGGLSYSARSASRNELDAHGLKHGQSHERGDNIENSRDIEHRVPAAGADVSTLAKGTRREAVPFAVYSIP